MTDFSNQVNKNNDAEELKQYLGEIQSIPLLSPEEELEIAKCCASGDELAIRKMVVSNLRLVVSVAKAYANRGVLMMDLIQEGSIGLFVAAQKFDYTKQVRFSTYATKWIRQRIARYVLNHGNTIRIPVHTAEKLHKISAARTVAVQEGRKAPTISELAALVDMPEDNLKDLLSQLPEVSSLNAPFNDDEEGTLEEVVENTDSPRPQEELIRRELENIIHELMDKLDDRQKKIIRMHFGFDTDTDRSYSLEEIAKDMNLSKERVRQIEHQALDKMHLFGKRMGLEDFLDD